MLDRTRCVACGRTWRETMPCLTKSKKDYKRKCLYCLKCDQLCYEAVRRDRRYGFSGAPFDPHDFRDRFYAEIERTDADELKTDGPPPRHDAWI